MFSSLQTRLWLTYALLISMVLGIIGLTLLVVLLRNPVAVQRLTLASRTIAARLDNLPTQGNLPRLAGSLQRVDESFDVRLLLLSPDGTTVIDTRGDRADPLQIDSPRLSRRTSGVLRDAGNQTWQYLARPLDSGWTLLLATPRQRPLASLISAVSENLLRPFFFAGAGALLLAVVLSFLMARWISAPLERMAAAARGISAGNYQTIQPEGPQEVQELAQALNEMTVRVQASQQSQRDFIANVSHELKTPLTSIQGFAQAMLDGTVDTRQALQQAAGVIFSEAGRMHRLVLDLLDLARLDAGTFEFSRSRVNLSQVLESVARKFTLQAQQARVDLHTEIEDLPVIIADGDRLAQVFTNLVDNALKHTPAGGQVGLVARHYRDRVEISVTDTGPGIPAHDLSRIFERFYQLDKSRRGGASRGAGLGLAIASEIVQAHSGRLKAYSQPGEGSVFVVELPIIRADDETISIHRKSGQ